MLSNDISQLPVMSGERTVKGMVSWESIGSRFSLGQTPLVVRDCMEQAHEVSADASLFSVINKIIENQYVLVRADDGRITGIVTTSDLSEQFQKLSEPFLLLGEIENHIRKLIDGRFTQPEITSARDSADPNRAVSTVADLTFGEYLKLLEQPANWAKLKLKIDRAAFIKDLDKVRIIRNDIMHFDPDGISEDDQEMLRKFVRFLQRLQLLNEL